MHRSNPRRRVSQNTLKEANRSRVERDRDLKEKAAEKRCRSQPRDRGKVAGKKRRKSAKRRRGKEEVLKVDPKKSSGGDLKGRRAD